MRVWKKVIIAIAALVGVAALVGGYYVWNNVTWNQRLDARVAGAGFVEKQATVDGVTLNFGENPASAGKPVLVLLHGQGGAWQSYHSVLRGLAQEFHVFAIDVPGHGKSDRWQGHYTAVELGDLVAHFANDVIGAPVFVSGHSSGGHIAATFAANHPEQVRGVLFEDPPFFTTELPRAKETWNWQDLASAANSFIDSNESDWPGYYWEHQLMWKFFGPDAGRIINDGLRYHEKHPDQPIRVWYLPGIMAEYARYSIDYDPYFGLAFYDGSWNQGFDQEATLRAIEAPVIYVRAKEVLGDDGVLQAAASYDEARRALECLPGAKFVEADTSHNYHGDKPGEFVDLTVSLLNEQY
ncbi:alpha/beta hydrolase [Corynebacterium breve]|uniref:Alpha/beta hydrolase n=1 Tax=Corynebacterium breve TaxID=3049799 RepID=A0ABY8VCU8_9CORY|nr:alpha/beta hydrolase [Corynebacterium breve]WIM67485.1 alpha/beta hydrolase [Corynebacterium breve]